LLRNAVRLTRAPAGGGKGIFHAARDRPYFTVVHIGLTQLSARCTVVTLLRDAHGITCRCSGIRFTSAFCASSASWTSPIRPSVMSTLILAVSSSIFLLV